MRNFSVVIAVCLGIFTLGFAEPKCHLSELFACVDKPVDYINSLPRRSLPKTNDDVEKFCKALDEGTSCMEDYQKRCMTPIQRELVSLSSEGSVDLQNKFCGSPTGQVRTDYLTHAECLNKVTQGEGTNQNLQFLLAISEKFLTLPNSKRLSYLCCGYTKVYDAIRSEASSTCGEDAVQVGEELITLALAQLPNMLCAGFDGASSECSEVLPPEGSKPTDEFLDSPVYKFIYNLIKNYLE